MTEEAPAVGEAKPPGPSRSKEGFAGGGLMLLSVALQVEAAGISGSRGEVFYLAGMAVGAAGVALFAWSRERSLWFALLALIPNIGPVLGFGIRRKSRLPAQPRHESLMSLGILFIIAGLLFSICLCHEGNAMGVGSLIVGLGFVLGAVGGNRGWRLFPWAPCLAGAMLGFGAFAAGLSKSPLIRKSNEGAARAGLSAMRTALSIYQGKTNGRFPADLSEMTRDSAFRLPSLPAARIPPYHAASNAVRQAALPDDRGGWLYVREPGDDGDGRVMVNCTHTDTRGSVWASY